MKDGFLKEYWAYLNEVPIYFLCYSDQDRKNVIGTLELAPTDEEEE